MHSHLPQHREHSTFPFQYRAVVGRILQWVQQGPKAGQCFQLGLCFSSPPGYSWVKHPHHWYAAKTPQLHRSKPEAPQAESGLWAICCQPLERKQSTFPLQHAAGHNSHRTATQSTGHSNILSIHIFQINLWPIKVALQFPVLVLGNLSHLGDQPPCQKMQNDG